MCKYMPTRLFKICLFFFFFTNMRAKILIPGRDEFEAAFNNYYRARRAVEKVNDLQFDFHVGRADRSFPRH